MNRQVFSQIVGEDWFDILDDVIDDEVELQLDKVKQLYSNGNVYPEPQHIFRAFQECPLNNLKVIWWGQDPYPNGEATGLAFEVKGGFKLTPSYNAILDAYNDCFPQHFNIDVLDGNLTELAHKGILWLNTALTVEKNKPNSHKEYWKLFTERFIKEMDKSYNDLIFVGLGKEAETLLTNIKNHKIILEHPAYAARQGRKWKHNNVFIKINEYLKQTKLGEIDWL